MYDLEVVIRGGLESATDEVEAVTAEVAAEYIDKWYRWNQVYLMNLDREER